MHEETMQAQVIGVDYSKRLVALRGPARREATVVVSPEVQNFDRLKVGDIVNVLYGERLATRGIVNLIDHGCVWAESGEHGAVMLPFGRTSFPSRS